MHDLYKLFEVFSKKNEKTPPAMQLHKYVDYECSTLPQIQAHMETVGVFYTAVTEDGLSILAFQYSKMKKGRITRCAAKITVHHLRGIVLDFAKSHVRC